MARPRAHSEDSTLPATDCGSSTAMDHTRERVLMSDRFEQGKNIVQALAGRRTFLQKLASAGTVLAVAGTRANAQTQLPAITDADLLNFLLNLEYLEAEFYTYATTGKGIAFYGFGVSGTGAEGDTTGGQMV